MADGRIKNLTPFNTMDPKKKKEIQSKGGKASRISRNKRKKLKEELLLLLSEKDTQKSISVALINNALDGNIKAFEVIRDTIGEKPKEEVSVELNNIATEEVEKYINGKIH